MARTLESKTLVTIHPDVSRPEIQKTWGELAFVYIGSKHKAMLERIYRELTTTGRTWRSASGLASTEPSANTAGR